MFRRLKVIDKVPESSVITSFYLQPVDAEDWQAFEPGQFLVFRIPAANDRGYEFRNYSVSSSAGQPGTYRISVKREAAPNADLPDGLGSCYLHDHVIKGDELTAAGPRGEFRLDRDSDRPVVLLSGGVGLTPMVSMLHVLAEETERRVYFIHACDNGEVHALGDEVRELTASRPGLTMHTCYRFPTAADLDNCRHDSEGVITADLLQRVLPLDDYDVYLCGPPPFMKAVYQTLTQLGVPAGRIAYEFFGPATVLETDRANEVPSVPAPAPLDEEAKPAAASSAAKAAATHTSGPLTVTFSKSDQSAAWEDSESLLDFAESQGLSPAFSCRAGICGSCTTPLLEGEVDYFIEPLDPVDEGCVLLCSCRPRTAIVVDL